MRTGIAGRRRRDGFTWATAFSLAVLMLASCAAPGPGAHIVMFEADGGPVDPTRTPWSGGYARLDPKPDAPPRSSYDAYLDTMMAGLTKHVEDTGRKRVVVFIHGGLNTRAGTVARARALSPEILGDTGSDALAADPAYPIFVNWRSSLTTSYGSHLLWVRQGGALFGNGNDWGDNAWDAVQFLFAPVVLAADIVRGVLRLPMVTVHQLEEATEWLGAGRSPEREDADRAAKCFVNRHLLGTEELALEAHAVKGERSSGVRLEEVGGVLRWFILIPIKIVTTTIVDIAGTGSWNMMKRRVGLLFEPEAARDPGRAEREPYGLRRFLVRLAERQLELDLEIDLVGHSMGTIIANRILVESAREGDLRVEEDGELTLLVPRFDDVVYLGAACSVAEYENASFAYLHRNPETRVHHVVLHPDNEVGEATAWDLAPRGSLLTWIDDFLALPLTPADRAAGRSTNLLPALADTPVELRERISIRVLPWDVDGLPQSHGGFNDVSATWAFWRAACWWPDPGASELRSKIGDLDGCETP